MDWFYLTQDRDKWQTRSRWCVSL